MQKQERTKLIDYVSSMTNRSDTVRDEEYPFNDLEYWVIGLDQWGRRISVCAAVSAARSVLSVWEDYFPEYTEIRSALEFAEKWLQSPETTPIGHAEEYAERAFDAASEYTAWDQNLEGSAAQAAAWAANAVYCDPTDAYVAARCTVNIRKLLGDANPLDTVYRLIRDAILQFVHSVDD